jgi:hypothetical protein
MTSLDRLALDHVDLYLLHWPAPALGLFIETYTVLEQLRDEGLTPAIGVSNFQPQHLRQLLPATTVTPAVNQIELHPYLQQSVAHPPCRTRHRDRSLVTARPGQPASRPRPARNRPEPGADGRPGRAGLAPVPRHSGHPPVDGAWLHDANLSAIDNLDGDHRLGPHPDEVDGR